MPDQPPQLIPANRVLRQHGPGFNVTIDTNSPSARITLTLQPGWGFRFLNGDHGDVAVEAVRVCRSTAPQYGAVRIGPGGEYVTDLYA